MRNFSDYYWYSYFTEGLVIGTGLLSPYFIIFCPYFYASYACLESC